jgi:hypothetical protein
MGQPADELAGLERKPQAKARHEGVDGAEWKQVVRAERAHFSYHSLRVRDIEEIDRRDQVPPLVERKVPSESQVQQVHTRQPLNAGSLQDDRLTARNCWGETLAIRYREGLRRLDWISRVVLKVDAGVNLEWELIAAVHLKDIRCVAVQDVVLAIDVQVRIREIVKERVVAPYRPGIKTFLPLNCESAKNLPLV